MTHDHAAESKREAVLKRMVPRRADLLDQYSAALTVPLEARVRELEAALTEAGRAYHFSKLGVQRMDDEGSNHTGAWSHCEGPVCLSARTALAGAQETREDVGL